MKGFSAVELLIIIAAILILTLIITGAFSKFRDTQALNGAVEEVVALINEARSKTLSSANFSQHGAHFETNRVVLFQGAIFSPSDSNNKELKFPDFVEIFSITLNGGGADMVFQKLTGKTSQYGTIILRAKKDTAKTKTITVESTGIISI
jgi:Tfp pilus assembly protein FimT